MKRKGFAALLAFLFTFCLCSNAWAGYSITISKANNKLALYKNGSLIRVFPVATGSHPSFTPEGKFTVVSKLVNPFYVRGNIPGGSPNNPLGVRWIGLSIGGGGTYGIHGNNNPASIGTYASAGCIRMHNNDVIWLYNLIPIGTPVIINNIPIDAATGTPHEKLEPPPIKLVVGNEVVDLPGDLQPWVRDKHLYIPFRPAIEKLGYQLVWHTKYNIAEITRDNHKTFIDVEGNAIMTNGQFSRLPGRGEMRGSNLFLPLGFFNLLPGIAARWDEEKGEVKLQREKLNSLEIIK